MIHYVIKVIENGQPKYVFNTRVLLDDIALAKPFSSALLANHYSKKIKAFAHRCFVIPIEEREPTIDRRTLSSIVE